MTFKLLNVDENIVKALKEDGIVDPTNIQNIAIPIIKEGKDVIGISRTGSGKTAAFGIPVLEKIESGKGIQVLITVPTRELAVQIAKELEKFSKYMKCNIATVFGGVGIEPQIKNLRTADIVVGTTGRILDHVGRRTIDLSKLKCIVLDEADKMVEMGFIEDIEAILLECPKNRQILLFGATISDEINHLKKKYMNTPEIAKAEMHVKKDLLEQYYYDVGPGEKFSLLVHLLKKEDTDRVMIFCATRATVEILAKNLKEHGIKAAMIHGKLTQNRRLRIIEDFNNGRPKILVASAVAARGLDIREVTHVFNYGLSKDPQEYVHRVGRTARAGESGKAFTLLEPRDYQAFDQIMRRYSIEIIKLPAEEFEKLKFVAKQDNNRSNFRGGGKRFGNRQGNRSGGRGHGPKSHGQNRNRGKFSSQRRSEKPEVKPDF